MPRPVFISYSHDSAEHERQVLALSNRLRGEGVDCYLDQYVESPPEGWPAWMNRHIVESAFVLVVCTETYARRVMGNEEPGRGLGATWEGGLITQAIYDTGGLNARFLPVLFDRDDQAHIPPFLQRTTRYLIDGESGYEQLYRRLTEQPAVEMPPLGTVRTIPAEPEPQPLAEQLAERATGRGAQEVDDRDLDALALFMPERGAPFFATTVRIETGDPQPFGGEPSSVTVEVDSGDAKTSALLAGLRGHRGSLGVAYGSTATLGAVQDVRQARQGGRETWTVVLTPRKGGYGGGLTEMAFEGYSADDIARLRARRILLGEELPGQGQSSMGKMNDSMLETLVQGVSVALPVRGSPLPSVFAAYQSDLPLFLATARLFGVLFLCLSGTVERVLRLDLEMDGPGQLGVQFEGLRYNPYSNVEAVRLEVSGTCTLTPEASGAGV